MRDLDPTTVLTVFRREGCTLCDDAESLLRIELEARAAEGHPAPRIERVDVDTDPDLERRYGARLPVLAIGEDEIELVTSGSRIRGLLDRSLPTSRVTG